MTDKAEKQEKPEVAYRFVLRREGFPEENVPIPEIKATTNTKAIKRCVSLYRNTLSKLRLPGWYLEDLNSGYRVDLQSLDL
ncbi:MAG: hypothetical protein E6R03_11615 [Hyphomicrobiaceae bacterium]|nr:MAG: hypothetical protein E6R03_11615 [Hyphomicrobiaceae bacterium]